MLTDFRKRKLMALFDMYDVDKNGLLEQADYERIAQNLAASLHYQPGSPEYARLYADRMANWHNIYQLCGAPSSQRVTQEEFLAALDRLLSDKNHYQAVISRRTDYINELSDQDGDGRLSQQQYVANGRSYGTDEATANEAFRRLDLDGDGYLTHDEISQAVEEFFYSEDPQAPGNWLFGPIDVSGLRSERLIQSLIDAFNAKDVDRYAANATADCEVLDVPSGMTFRGPDGYRQFVQSYLTAFPDAQVQATSLFTTEDQGHLEYIGRGTNTGPFPYASGPIPPTGRRVEFRVCAGLQFREGKVASVHYYYDLLSLLQQLGLVPTPDGRLMPIA